MFRDAALGAAPFKEILHMLEQDIKSARIEAMKQKDKVASGVLSVVLNKIMLATIEKRKDGAELTDADVVGILQKTEKELYDERDGFVKANRPEKVAELDHQVETVKKFIPAMMSEEEIRSVIESLPDKSIGAVMRHFKSEYAGKCDMKTVGEVLRKL